MRRRERPDGCDDGEAAGAARMGAGPVEGEALLRWAEVLLRAVVEGDPAYETEAAAYRRRR